MGSEGLSETRNTLGDQFKTIRDLLETSGTLIKKWIFFEFFNLKMSFSAAFARFSGYWLHKNVSILRSKPLIKNLTDRSSQKQCLSLEIKAYDPPIIIKSEKLIFFKTKNTYF